MRQKRSFIAGAAGLALVVVGLTSVQTTPDAPERPAPTATPAPPTATATQAALQVGGPWIPANEDWQGIDWQSIRAPADGAPGWESLWGATRSGDRILAFGEGRPARNDRNDGHGVDADVNVALSGGLWTTADGIRWTQHDLRLADGTPFLAEAVVLGPVGFLAVGNVMGEAEEERFLAWSADGTTWTEANPPIRGWLGPLLGTADGFWLVAGVNGRTSVWRTLDGRGWTDTVLPHPGGDLEVSALTATHQGVILSGSVRGPRDIDAVIWRWEAASGAWVQLESEEQTFVSPKRGAMVSRVVPFAGGLFATGWAGDIPDCQLGMVRIASLLPTPPERPETADHCPGLPAAAWVSQDGLDWREVEGPEPARLGADGTAGLSAVDVGGAGLVALVAEQAPAVDIAKLGLWTSADGVEWVRLADGMNHGEAWFNEFLTLPGRVVAIGGDRDSGAVVWVGRPLR